MKIMISQPMRNLTNEEIAEIRKPYVEELEAEGHEVIDTILTGHIDGEGVNYAINCLAKCLEFIAQSDAVVFLPGWEKARGCRIEYETAKEYEKFIRFMK